MRASREPHTAFGRYENIFLSESEYAELEAEYPDGLERFLAELSQYMAATGKNYRNYAAAVRMWAERDRKKGPKKGMSNYSYREDGTSL